MRVAELMNKPQVIDKDTSIKQAVKIMSDKQIGSLIVISDKEIGGIITERDILKNVDKLSQPVSKIMTRKVITIDKKESVENAALIMGKNKIKRLPVIDNGKLVGIITATDILANSEDFGEQFFFD